jgi:hypothetical protein
MKFPDYFMADFREAILDMSIAVAEGGFGLIIKFKPGVRLI